MPPSVSVVRGGDRFGVLAAAVSSRRSRAGAATANTVSPGARIRSREGIASTGASGGRTATTAASTAPMGTPTSELASPTVTTPIVSSAVLRSEANSRSARGSTGIVRSR